MHEYLFMFLFHNLGTLMYLERFCFFLEFGFLFDISLKTTVDKKQT